MSWYSRCSWCGCPFNGGNCRCCTNKTAFVANSVFANGVDLVLEKEFASFALQAANNSTHTPEPSQRFNSICYDDDDDDEERTIPLRDIISQLPPSIVITTSPPFLPIEDSEDSLIMGNEDLNTILEKETDEFIKSSVEDLIPIPNESEDTSGSYSECIFPSCNDFSPINVFEEKFMTFSNPIFDSNDNFTSSDDESLSDEDVLEDNVLENIESKDSYYSNLDEPDLLVTPLSDANEDKCFDPEGDFDEIDAFLDIDTSTDVKDGYHDSEGDIIYLESLLTNETIHSLPSEVFLHHDTKSLKDESVINDSKNMVKIFDPEIHEKKISPTYVSLPFTDRYYLFFTYIIRILLLYFTYPVVSPFLLSSGGEDTIFDPGISAFHFSHRSRTLLCFNVYSNILNESPMEICSSTCFYPNITMI
uniref:Pre-mRNA splicing Prp18-interacting factor n=1 Tax=Tanacetum cinerariifolium TaxID=118510 RepID=A0A699II29_TANCI|nr:hypothetical protein [Tanacetum cinerariifolium]